MSAARPLSRSLRAEMEALFGAGFTRVRVHESAPTGPLAYARGEDVFFAPGAYDPWTPRGREILGHELAHVLQQRFGRVPDGTGRRALEVEAALAGRAIARGEPVRIPGRAAARRTVATQCYQVVTPANRAAAGLAVVNPQQHAPHQPHDTFLGQDKGGAGALSPRSFLLAAGGVNISAANPAAVNIRLSAGGNMAIEDADLGTRQPKVCYASQAIINAANLALTAVGSPFSLVGDPIGPNQQRITVGGVTLLRVTVQNNNTHTAGLTMRAPQSCNTLILEVLHLNTITLVPRFLNPLAWAPTPVPEYHIARALLVPQPAQLTYNPPVTLANTMRAITVPYSAAALAAGAPFVGLLQNHGLNEYAAPQVGRGFLTASLIAAAAGAGIPPGPPTHSDHYHLAGGLPMVVHKDRTWSTHYGAVVAVDGTDVITLENYARNTEDALADSDTRYYFQMYTTNPPPGGAGSWHHTWTTTPMQPIAGGGAPQPPPHAAATHEPVSPGARGFANPLTMMVGS
ncbi:MAG TPA: DUF4157 domain-containing protein [Streptosporangiaceae bacterium]|jgi:hypothetical protein|nr:DUF4157 domain-containing protein [Streptosporangiaceae bacterium]